MEEKKEIRVSLSTFFLILAIIVIGVMGYFIYKLNDDKTKATEQVSELNNQIKSLENSVSSLQKAIENTSNIEKDTQITSNTSSTEKTEIVQSNTKNNTTTNKITDVSEIKKILKNQGKYEVLEVANIKKENDKYFVEANYYAPKVFTEQQYTDMVKNKKIILNNKEYIYEPNSAYGTYVYIEGEALENGYRVEKVENGCIFLGGYNNDTIAMIKELKATYAFYLDANTEISSWGDIHYTNEGVPTGYSVIVYDRENDRLYISVDPR